MFSGASLLAHDALEVCCLGTWQSVASGQPHRRLTRAVCVGGVFIRCVVLKTTGQDFFLKKTEKYRDWYALFLTLP